MTELSTLAQPFQPAIRALQEQSEHPENRLLRIFPQLVGSLVLDEVAVPYWRKEITDIEELRLVPIVPTIPRPTTMSSSGFFNKTHRGVRSTYPAGPDLGPPFLDTRQAIGLAHNDRLLTIASAGIPRTADGRSNLQVVQIQNVSGVKRSDPEYDHLFTSNGIDWKKTLVSAWENVGHAIEVDAVVIQSHRNNDYAPVRMPQGADKYDGVAKQMGYRQSDHDGNWVKPQADLVPVPRRKIGLRDHLGALILSLR